MMKKGLLIKILIPLVLVLIVAGIWGFKSFQKGEENTSSSSISKTSSGGDFALNQTEKIDLEKMKSYNIPILLEFGSETCAPCLQMAPIIKALNNELQGKAIVKYIDVGEDTSLADGFPLSVIPTQFFFDSNGKPYNPADPDAMGMSIYKNKEGEHIYTTHEGTITKAELITILKEMGMKE